MELLTEELKAKLPPLYGMDDKKPQEVPVVVKFFNPCGAGTWYATEACARLSDGREVTLAETKDLPAGVSVEDVIFFGLASIVEPELGYFSLSELQGIRLLGGALGIERDLHLGKLTLAQAMEREGMRIAS